MNHEIAGELAHPSWCPMWVPKTLLSEGEFSQIKSYIDDKFIYLVVDQFLQIFPKQMSLK